MQAIDIYALVGAVSHGVLALLFVMVARSQPASARAGLVCAHV